MKVKPLKWGKIEGTGYGQEWHVAGDVDTYLVCKDDDNWLVSIGNQTLGGNFSSLEAAKAAAEADWQQRGSDLLAKIAEPGDDYRRGYEAGIDAAAQCVEDFDIEWATSLEGNRRMMVAEIRKLGEKL